MSGSARKLTRDQEKARARTQRGVCARCAVKVEKHTGPERLCPDGQGSYTWAMSRDDLERQIAELEAFKAQIESAAKVPLTPMEQRVLDHIVDDSMQGHSPQAPKIAEQLSLPLFQVRLVLDALVDKGMILRAPGTSQEPS